MNLCIYLSLELIFVLCITTKTEQCSEKLLENRKKVPDSAFIASSYKDEYRGKWARESVSNELAWCPKNTIYMYKKDFLTIDLGDIYMLKMIMTKGLSRHGFYSASFYTIEYKRELNSSWIPYRSRGVEKKIKGNTDHLTESFESLDPPIIARWVKIFPFAKNPERICLVLQIYGCKYMSNIMEYRVLDGSSKGNLDDYIYDGNKSYGFLSGGLGKLVFNTDNKMIDNPFEASNEYIMGWHKDQFKTHQLEMIFRFKTYQNFSRLTIDVSNFFSAKVSLFSHITVQFSYDGTTYDENKVLQQSISNDVQYKYFRHLIVDLKQNIGLFVKISLSFRLDWMVINTVEFISDPCENCLPIKPSFPKGEEKRSTGFTSPPLPGSDFLSTPLAYILVIVISILFIMLIIGIPCVTIFVRRQKYRNKKCKEALRRHFQEEQARFLTLSQQHFKDSAINKTLFTVSNFNPSLPNINGRMMQESSIYTSLAGSDTESNCPSDKQHGVAPNFNFINTCPIINPLNSNRGSMSNDYSATSFISLGSNGASHIPYYINNAQMARSQLNLKSHYDMINPSTTIQNDSYSTDEYSQRSIPMYGPARVSIQGPLRNSKLYSLIATSETETIFSLSSSLHDFTFANAPLENLKYLRTISRGHYGSIHVGEWTKIQDHTIHSSNKYQCDSYNTMRQSLTISIETEMNSHQYPERHISSIKVLSKNASQRMKTEFCKEIKKLLSINHKSFPSILKIEETPLGDCVIVSEHTPIGDLYNYLQNCSVKDISDPFDETATKFISQSSLIYVASQVASGMKHLESLKLVHRDLSCRNIFVMNEELTIKISDLAIANEAFSSDYVVFTDSTAANHMHKSTSSLIQLQSTLVHTCQGEHHSGMVLPIRWMSWQALLQGNFSSKSDVYSFGVTLWELLTLCRKQPYHELTNEQVLINSNLQAVGDERARSLYLPGKFSKGFSDFISHCMHFNESTRPSFTDVDMFLQHKCVGYKTL